MFKEIITTVPKFFENYIKLVPEGNLIDNYKNQSSNLIDFYTGIDEDKSLHSYDKGKWSIRELVGHLCDTERIFAYRALRIARNDKTNLAGFDENIYVQTADFNRLSYEQILSQFNNLRNSNYDLFSSFTENDFEKIGIVENNELSVSSILAILIGHSEHHKKIVIERYL